MIIEVNDPGDARLDPFRWRDRQLASKLDRLDMVGAGLFVAEGDLVVERAIELGYHAVALLCDETTGNDMSARIADDVDIFIAPELLRGEVTGLGVPLRATGLFRRPPLRSIRDVLASAQRVILAEDIDNPTNLGAIIRSAAALGWDAIVLAPGSADPLARRALRVSMGAGLSLPFSRLAPTDDLALLLSEHLFTSFALTPEADATDIALVPRSLNQKIALLLGSERDGLDDGTIGSATHAVRIPMHAGIDSLNVGAAAAVAMHALGPNGINH